MFGKCALGHAATALLFALLFLMCPSAEAQANSCGDQVTITNIYGLPGTFYFFIENTANTVVFFQNITLNVSGGATTINLQSLSIPIGATYTLFLEPYGSSGFGFGFSNYTLTLSSNFQFTSNGTSTVSGLIYAPGEATYTFTKQSQAPCTGIDVSQAVAVTETEWESLLTMLMDVNGAKDSMGNPLGSPQFVIAEAYAGAGGTTPPANQTLANYETALSALPYGGTPHMAAYVYLGFCPTCVTNSSGQPDSGSDQVDEALQSVCGASSPGTPSCPLAQSLGFLAVDIECVNSGSGNQCGNFIPPSRSPDASISGNIQTIYEAVQEVQTAGLQPVIYSEERSWNVLTGGQSETAGGIPGFGCIPLWTDQPQNDIAQLNAPVAGSPTAGPFGSWAAGSAIGLQYQTDSGTGVLQGNGVYVDLDIFAGLQLFTPPPAGTAACAQNPSGCMAQDLTLTGSSCSANPLCAAANLTLGSWTNPNPSAAVLVQRGGERILGLPRANPLVEEMTFTLTNTSMSTVSGPFWLVFDNLATSLASLEETEGNL